MRCIAFVLSGNVIGKLTFMSTVIRATDGGKFCFVAKSRSCDLIMNMITVLQKNIQYCFLC